MKQRLFPKSFWQQPNLLYNATNTNKSNSKNTIIDQFQNKKNEPVFKTRTTDILITSPPDTQMLFSLFRILDNIDSSNTIVIDNNNNNISTQPLNDKKDEDYIISTNNIINDDDRNEDKHKTVILDDPYLSQLLAKNRHASEFVGVNKKFNKKECKKTKSEILSELVLQL